MKKILVLGLLALSLASQVSAYTPLDGGMLVVAPTARQNKGSYSQGSVPGAQIAHGPIGVALVNITAGDVLVGPLGSSVTARMGVSKTATAGDVTVIGIAATSANYGVTLTVATAGSILKCLSAVNVTVGLGYITSATAGQVTASTAVTDDAYTVLSGTPKVVKALETVSSGGGGYFLGYVTKP